MSTFLKKAHTKGGPCCCDFKIKMENVWVILCVLSQRNHWALIEGSSVVVAQIRFFRIRTLRPGQWTRTSCIMEPVKRFSPDSLPGNALCRTQHHLSPTLPSSITLPLHSHRLHPPLGGRVRTSGETLSCHVPTLHLSPRQPRLLLSTYVIIISSNGVNLIV